MKKKTDQSSDLEAEQSVAGAEPGATIDRRGMFKLAAYAAPATLVLMNAQDAQAVGCSYLEDPEECEEEPEIPL